MKDVAGNSIHEGAILKVFHFIDRRRRKHFMYKQVGKSRGKFIEIHHLPLNSEDGFYLKKDDEVLDDSLVVQCNCEFHIYNNLKTHKGFKSC